jgi:LysM repeat protein
MPERIDAYADLIVRVGANVQPGQTLWGIATQAAPHADPRATVQRIIDLNHLAGTNLQVGESLTLPS